MGRFESNLWSEEEEASLKSEIERKQQESTDQRENREDSTQGEAGWVVHGLEGAVSAVALLTIASATDNYLTSLGAVFRADDAVFLQEVDQARGA